MDVTIFKKMKARPGSTAIAMFAPDSYPAADSGMLFFPDGTADFIHLFVTSREEFTTRIGQALRKRNPGAQLWVSCPKSVGKQRYDINRDNLRDLSIPYDIHPVAQVALDETWSALRFMDNRTGKVFERPNTKK